MRESPKSADMLFFRINHRSPTVLFRTCDDDPLIFDRLGRGCREGPSAQSRNGLRVSGHTKAQRAFHYENKEAICVQGHCFSTTDTDAIDNQAKLWVMERKEKQELRGTRVSLSQAGSKLLGSLHTRCR